MFVNHSNQNLQRASFKDQDLSYADFSDSDLRGADFTGADLTGTNFINVRTGITTGSTILIFVVALVFSLFAGYIAMLAGHMLQTMIASADKNVHYTGIAGVVVTILFIMYAWLKGVGTALMHLIIPSAVIAIVVGVVFYMSGKGTGQGMLYLLVSFLLVAALFLVGTVARAAAGSLSNFLFLVVALSGGMFGKSVGGGIGAVIVALACALISKRALSGAKGFETLREIAAYITTRFGTSFRNCRLTNANFSHSKIQNTDFTNADLTSINWGDSKRQNCVVQSFVK